MDIAELLKNAANLRASDIHLSTGMIPFIRVNGELMPLSHNILEVYDINALINSFASASQKRLLEKHGEIDFSILYTDVGRLRINIYKEARGYSLAIRLITDKIPTISQLKLPSIINKLACKRHGMIIITGATGSGKTTTMAAILNEINITRKCNIITLEQPIEYIFTPQKSIIHQREIGVHTPSFEKALRAALRQDPDVILIGEMRDYETIATALTAAETGHLIISTLHTMGCIKSIDRIIDVFPSHQQNQVRIQLSTVLQGIIFQQLVPMANNPERIAAMEIMINTPAVANMIRAGRTNQIYNSIQTGSQYGMQTMDAALHKLYHQNLINWESVELYSQ